MKSINFLFLLYSLTFFAQINTEVHIFDILETENGYNLINGKNISNNPGYDNQPFFYKEDVVLFSSNQNGNTEIVLKDLNSKSTEIHLKSNTLNGGEYSPQRIPNSTNISAVRLDNDGLQRFYRYDFTTKKSTVLIPDLKIAYPSWLDKNTVVASVIANETLELFICDLKKKTQTSVAKNVGRSIHKIPNSDLLSFISKEHKDNWLLKSLNPKTKEIKVITSLGKSEDVVWMPNGHLLISKENMIYKFNPKEDKNMRLFFRFSDENINNISRMAINKKGTKIALVAEVSPEYLAQEQLDAYNKRDIDAFLQAYAKNVKVFNFPNTLHYEGIENMRKRYESFFKNTPDLHCKLLKRIVYKDQVIDHELVTANGKTFKAVAIYKIENGKIRSVTFM